jgi:hypothetical protein
MVANRVPRPVPNPDQDSAPRRAFSRLLGGTLGLAKSWVGLLTAYFAAVAAVFAGYKKFPDEFKQLDWRVQAAILGFLPLCALVFQAIPDLRDWLKRRRLLEVKGSARRGYFQLAPREAGDIYERTDGAHEEVLTWILGCKEMVLYLTGLSGSGKSSILGAHVIPALQQKSAKIIRLRGYQDPAATLRNELLTPGEIWKKPPAEVRELDLPEILRRACDYLGAAPLYVIVDQFEEFVILQDEQSQARFRGFVHGLLDDPPEGLTLLFSFRSDYISVVEKLGLPLLLQRTNWKDVPPFTEAQAREYVQKSGLQVDEDFLRQVLREAAEIEQTRGFIRPVTINLCGLVLARFVGGPPRGFRPGGLVRGFLHESLRMEGVLEAGPAVVGELISSHLTKKPKRIVEIAASTGLSRELVRGCLRRLGAPDRAIVRPLDSREEVWEISHDFLVPLLDSVVARWRVSMWRKARPWLPWVAAVVTILTAIGLNNWQQPDPLPQLVYLGWRTAEPQAGKNGEPGKPREQEFIGESAREETHLAASVPYLNRIREPIQVLIRLCSDSAALSGWTGGGRSSISLDTGGNCGVDRAPGNRMLATLRHLKNLTTLNLSSPNNFSDLEPLRNLKALTKLNLSAWKVSDLEPLKNLTALTQLDLETPNVSDLEPLRNLKALTELNLSAWKVSDLEPLKNLTALTQLDLAETKVSDLEPLKNLTALTDLDLQYTNVSNLDPLRNLKKLTQLNLDCTEIRDLEPLKDLNGLKALNLSGDLKIKSVSPLATLSSLRFVALDSELRVDLTPLQNRKDITVDRDLPPGCER